MTRMEWGEWHTHKRCYYMLGKVIEYLYYIKRKYPSCFWNDKSNNQQW